MEGFDEILHGLHVLHDPLNTVNLRAKRTDDTVANLCIQGNLSEVAHRAHAMSESGLYSAVWATLNPLNKVVERGGAKDYDVSYRRWFPIDIDAVRGEAGGGALCGGVHMPASDVECGHAEALYLKVAAFLAARGWPDPVRAFGGNSYHLLYEIALPTGSTLVSCGLGALHARFSNERAVVDRTNGNASRVWKIYGTASRKGDASPTRPFRKSRIISVPLDSPLVTAAQLTELIRDLTGVRVEAEEPLAFQPLPQGEWDQVLFETATLVDAWFTGIRGPKPYRGGRGDPGFVWEFTCPWVADHARDRWKAFVVLFRDGRHLSGCHGNRCRGSHEWSDLVAEAMDRSHA